MAKRKKSYKKTRSRSRSKGMGNVSGNLMNIVGLVAGAAAGRIVATKLLPKIDSKIKNAGVIALGAFVFPKLIKGGLGSSIGAGMVAAGGLGVMQDFNVIGAIEDTLSIPLTVGEVPEDISLIAGDDSVMAGDDSVMAGNFEEELSVIAGMEEDEDDMY
jgi:hypothetical protein